MEAKEFVSYIESNIYESIKECVGKNMVTCVIHTLLFDEDMNVNFKQFLADRNYFSFKVNEACQRLKLASKFKIDVKKAGEYIGYYNYI